MISRFLTSILLLSGAGIALAAAPATPAASSAPQVLYSLFDDGGEHQPDACDKARTMPEKFKKLNRLYRQNDYLGSHQIAFADQNQAGMDAWVHFFSSAKACEKVRLKMNKDANG